MSREILFRGKHIHVHPKNEHLDRTWVYGYLCDENYINSPELEGEFLIDTETVCQYTGLTDKNGRKIFEGDIFCIHDKNTFSVDFINGSFTVIPTYEIAKKIIRRKYLDEFARLSEYIEVIGNIFDNPELLA